MLAIRDQGKTAQQILDAFVAKYGEKALMAPKPRGVLNLTGYLLPGTLVAAAAAGLLVFIGRRKAAVAAATVGPASPTAGVTGPASEDELERLRRALSEIED